MKKIIFFLAAVVAVAVVACSTDDPDGILAGYTGSGSGSDSSSGSGSDSSSSSSSADEECVCTFYAYTEEYSADEMNAYGVTTCATLAIYLMDNGVSTVSCVSK